MEELLDAVSLRGPCRGYRMRTPADLVVTHEKEVGSWSRQLAVLSCITSSRYLATTSKDIEDIEDLVFVVI
jgi:hypothetical protein